MALNDATVMLLHEPVRERILERLKHVDLLRLVETSQTLRAHENVWEHLERQVYHKTPKARALSHCARATPQSGAKHDPLLCQRRNGSRPSWTQQEGALRPLPWAKTEHRD